MNHLFSRMCDDDVLLSRTAVEILNQFTGLSFKTKKEEENVNMERVCKALGDYRQEGMKNKAKETTIRMYARGMDINTIAEILEETKEQIRQ